MHLCNKMILWQTSRPKTK